MVFLRSHSQATRIQASWLPAARRGGAVAPGLLGALPSPRRRLRGCAQPCLALAFWVWGRVLACWPWGWDGWLHSSLRSGPDSSLVGLALATGPLDGTHGLWLFFLIPLGCVCDCDSGLCCGAPAEGSWLVLRGRWPVRHRGATAGGAQAAATPTRHPCTGAGRQEHEDLVPLAPQSHSGQPRGARVL